MTNYEQDTLALIPGDTPRQKFENMSKISDMIEKVVHPIAIPPQQQHEDNGWIRVESRLPETRFDVECHFTDYVTASDGKTVYAAGCAYYPDSKSWFMYGYSKPVVVTHWQPMPPPPTNL